VVDDTPFGKQKIMTRSQLELVFGNGVFDRQAVILPVAQYISALYFKAFYGASADNLF